MEQTQEKKYLIGSVVCGVLTALGVVTCILSLLEGNQGVWLFGDCVQILIYGLIAYYAFSGYKKPHGNLLKFVILMYALIFAACIPTLVSNGNAAIVTIYAVQIGLFCYIAGRLVKAKENLVLMILVTLCLVAVIAIEIFAGVANIGAVSTLIIWLDICVAYFLRYKQHKEAGLEDAPKK